MTTPTSPGWQPAPDGNGEQWWNGVDWSESRRGQRPAPAYGPPAPDSVITPVQRPNPYAPPTPAAAPNQYAPPQVGTPAQSMATTALVLGIVGIFIGVVGIVAVIIGVMARSRLNQEPALPKYRSYATTGIVLGAIGFGLSSFNVLLLFGSIFSPFTN